MNVLPAKRPLKVFLCHAHADRDTVRALYTRLTNDGVDAWLDKEKLLPGQDWELEIRKAVREADVVVVCLSKRFNQAGFRQKEVRWALDTAMEQPEGEIFIIPARLDECDTLESLRKWQWVDLFEDDGYIMLLRALGFQEIGNKSINKHIQKLGTFNKTIIGIVVFIMFALVVAFGLPQLMGKPAPTPATTNPVPILPTSSVEMSPTSQPAVVLPNDVFINNLAEDTFAYLNLDWVTGERLPPSWRSKTLPGGDYINPVELGFYVLSRVAAYEMKQSWSPDWVTTETKIIDILNQLRVWQTDPLIGKNAYNNSVFYQWYWINNAPPVVGSNTGDHLVPSIDNAWLAACLITIREYADANGHTIMAQKADAILTDMDFSLWYHADTHRFNWGGIEDPKGGSQADYYSDENRIINFIARALDDLDANEFALSLAVLEQPSGTYNGMTIENMAYDGSYINYTLPSLFIREIWTSYGTNTISPATLAQIKYAQDNGYKSWGFSDAYDIETGSIVQQGAPPVAMAGSSEVQPGLISPHVSALALITPYDTKAIENLQFIANTYDCVYDGSYGFVDSVIVDPSSLNFGKCSKRFSLLHQEVIFLSVANYLNDFVWNYFYKDEGVITAHAEMYAP